MGVSRTRFYEWRKIAPSYGIEALMPKDRRAPQLPNATPTHIVEDLLTLAVIEPTIGCRQYADRLAERGYEIGKIDRAEAPGRPRPRPPAPGVARAAAITAMTTGLITEPPSTSEPFGFCHFRPARATWWRWTASTSATSKASARCTSSPRSTPRPAGRSC